MTVKKDILKVELPEPTIRFDTEAALYVAKCPVTGVFSQGATKKKALKALEGAVRMFLKHSKSDA